MKKITKYSDPGHGWYRVPMSLVREAEAKGFNPTAFSYQSPSGKYAYLEEDCDASRFFEIFPRESFHVERRYTKGSARSQIRNYPSLVSRAQEMLNDFNYVGSPRHY